MNDEERMKAVNELVTASVKEGHSLADIAKEFANSDDPAEKQWAESFGKTAPTTSPANLSILDRAKKHLEETSGYQLAAEGIGLAVTPPIATHLGRRIIDKILPSPGVLVAEEQLKNRIGVPPTDGGPPPPPGGSPGGPSGEPSELDKTRLQREQHNMEIARQKALRETAATDLALAKAEAQKAKLAAQQAAPVGQQTGADPTFKDPLEQKLFEMSQAQQASKGQPPTPETLIPPPKEAPKPIVKQNEIATPMREQYKPGKKNPIGPGAFNHLANNLGLEKAVQVWEEVYGKKNVPYKQFIEDYSKAAGKEMMGPKQPLPPGAKPGGSFGVPKNIPEYIKGSGSVGGMAGLVGLAGLTALTSSPEARAAMGRAQSAIQDLGISPDIFAGKGEEMGRLGKGYVTAGNPQYRAQIAEQLKVEKDPERRQLLLEEFQKAGGSGAGRGVAPPSEYMR